MLFRSHTHAPPTACQLHRGLIAKRMHTMLTQGAFRLDPPTCLFPLFSVLCVCLLLARGAGPVLTADEVSRPVWHFSHILKVISLSTTPALSLLLCMGLKEILGSFGISHTHNISQKPLCYIIKRFIYYGRSGHSHRPEAAG